MILLKQIDPLPGITYGYEQIYEIEIEQGTVGTSDFAMLPAFLKPVLVAVFPSGGSCSVQTSSDAIDRIIDGTAVWETWAAVYSALEKLQEIEAEHSNRDVPRSA